MKTPKTVKEPIAMSKTTRKKLQAVSTLFKGKEMFPEKLERARQMFKGLTSIPAQA